MDLVIDLGEALRFHERTSSAATFSMRIRLDDVAFFEILELRDLNAALEAFGHFANVFLKAPQRFDLAVEDDRANRE